MQICTIKALLRKAWFDQHWGKHSPRQPLDLLTLIQQEIEKNEIPLVMTPALFQFLDEEQSRKNDFVLLLG
jgi:hypothetical protein